MGFRLAVCGDEDREIAAAGAGQVQLGRHVCGCWMDPMQGNLGDGAEAWFSSQACGKP